MQQPGVQRLVPSSGLFTLVWIGSLCGLLGGQLAIYAVPIMALRELGASASWVAILSGAGFLPYLLLGLPAGLIADRLNRRFVIVVSDSSRSTLIVLIPILHLNQLLSNSALLIIVFLVGGFTVLSEVAFQSSIPELVPRLRLQRVNSNIELARSLVQLAGPILAGLVIQIASATIAMLLNAVLLGVAAAFALAARMASHRVVAEAPGRSSGRRFTLLRDVAGGFTFLRREAGLGRLLLAHAVWVTGIGIFQAVFMVALVNARQLNSVEIGAVFAVGNGGFILGALLGRSAIARRNPGKAMLTGVVLCASGYLLIALAPLSWGVLSVSLLLLIASLGTPVYSMSFATVRQAFTPSEVMGRVASITLVVGRGMVPIGALLASFMLHGLSVESVIAVAGIFALIAAVIVWANSRYADRAFLALRSGADPAVGISSVTNKRK